MIGIEAKDLRVGDVVLGVGTVRTSPKDPDAWGEITFTVKDKDGGLYLVKVDADEWLRIERPDEAVE